MIYACFSHLWNIFSFFWQCPWCATVFILVPIYKYFPWLLLIVEPLLNLRQLSFSAMFSSVSSLDFTLLVGALISGKQWKFNSVKVGTLFARNFTTLLMVQLYHTNDILGVGTPSDTDLSMASTSYSALLIFKSDGKEKSTGMLFAPPVTCYPCRCECIPVTLGSLS